jgi:hypothetical protein
MIMCFIISIQVFLAQLHRRATLVNEEFQEWVVSVVRAHATEKDGVDTLVDERISGCIHHGSAAKDRASSSAVHSGPGGSPVIEISSNGAIERKPQTPTHQSADLCYSELALETQQSPMGDGFENHKKAAERQPSKQRSSNSYASSKSVFKSLGCRISDASRKIQKKLSITSNSSSMASFSTNFEHVTSASHGIETLIARTCSFDVVQIGSVDVFSAPVKTIDRMREKVLEYATESHGGGWPLCANILDPVRSSVVCRGPAQILQVFQWFGGSNQRTVHEFQEVAQSTTVRLMPISRVKNKFAFPKEELLGG